MRVRQERRELFVLHEKGNALKTNQKIVGEEGERCSAKSKKTFAFAIKRLRRGETAQTWYLEFKNPSIVLS
jgi:hypothetical protein